MKPLGTGLCPSRRGRSVGGEPPRNGAVIDPIPFETRIGAFPRYALPRVLAGFIGGGARGDPVGGPASDDARMLRGWKREVCGARNGCTLTSFFDETTSHPSPCDPPNEKKKPRRPIGTCRANQAGIEKRIRFIQGCPSARGASDTWSTHLLPQLHLSCPLPATKYKRHQHAVNHG